MGKFGQFPGLGFERLNVWLISVVAVRFNAISKVQSVVFIVVCVYIILYAPMLIFLLYSAAASARQRRTMFWLVLVV